MTMICDMGKCRTLPKPRMHTNKHEYDLTGNNDAFTNDYSHGVSCSFVCISIWKTFVLSLRRINNMFNNWGFNNWGMVEMVYAICFFVGFVAWLTPRGLVQSFDACQFPIPAPSHCGTIVLHFLCDILLKRSGATTGNKSGTRKRQSKLVA